MLARVVLSAVIIAAGCDAFLVPQGPFVGTTSRRSVLALSKSGAVPSRRPLTTSLRMAAGGGLESLTVAALREKLAQLGDVPPSKLKKAELIERIQVCPPPPPFPVQSCSATWHPRTDTGTPHIFPSQRQLAASFPLPRADRMNPCMCPVV